MPSRKGGTQLNYNNSVLGPLAGLLPDLYDGKHAPIKGDNAGRTGDRLGRGFAAFPESCVLGGSAGDVPALNRD